MKKNNTLNQIKDEKLFQKIIKEKKIPICEYYKEEDCYDNISDKYNKLNDIEDLLKEGKNKIFCPYFYNIFKTRKTANLTIMTYNYILNPQIRNQLNILEKNSIVILDEAHNICNNLEDAYSRKIKLDDLEKIQMLLQILLDFINKKGKNVYREEEEINPLILLEKDEINNQINAIKYFSKDINNLNFDEIVKNKQCKRYDLFDQIFYVCEHDFFVEKFENFQNHLYSTFLKVFNISTHKDKKDFNFFYRNKSYFKRKIKLSYLMNILNKISEFLEVLDLFHIPEIEPESESLSAFSLSDKYFENNDLEFKEKEAKEKIKRINKKEEIDSFRFIISKDNKNNKNNKNKLLFEIICLDASYGMKEYLKINPNSTVLTSGTLSLQSIENLLKVKFFKELKNNHVIKNDQFLINIINGYQINQKKYDYSFTYKNRDNKIQIKSLGNEIFNLVDSVKIGGVLVFFQSYEYLSKCYSIWLSEGLVKKYESIKKVVFDLSFNRHNNEDAIMEYKKNKNLLLFTVYRGKNSEGINFSDDEARMVICIGVPYPNLSDIKVQLKREFLDKRNKIERTGFDGMEWYKEEAMNAVNQSLGRLIRHVKDYGIMICFGIEFSYNIRYLSKWIKNNLTNKTSIIRLKENDKVYYSGLKEFLNNLKVKFPQNIININSQESKEDFSEEKDFGLTEEKYEDNNSEESWENINIDDENIFDSEKGEEEEKKSSEKLFDEIFEDINKEEGIFNSEKHENKNKDSTLGHKRYRWSK